MNTPYIMHYNHLPFPLLPIAINVLLIKIYEAVPRATSFDWKGIGKGD